MAKPIRYTDIKNEILKYIDTKSVKPGERLPSIRFFASRLKSSKTTVMRAYKALEDDHQVYAIQNSGYYYIGKTNQEREHGKQIINFRLAVPEKKLMPYKSFEHSIKRAVEVYKGDLFTYGKSEGLRELKLALRKHLMKRQVYTDVEKIHITSGGQQALYLLLNVLKSSEKRIAIVEEPTYSGLLRLIERSNFKCIGVKRTHDGLDLKELENLFQTGQVCFFYTVPNYHNPLGSSLTSSQKQAVLKLAQTYNVEIIEDDYLGDLNLDPKNFPLHYYDTQDRVIYISSFSKSFMPGIRIGMMVLPKRFKQIYLLEKHACDICTSVLAQGGLQLFIDSGMYENHIKKVRARYTEKMNRLRKYRDILCSFGVKVYVPHTGIFVWMELPIGMNAHHLENQLYEKNIHVYSGRHFFINSISQKNAIRLCLANVSIEDLDQGLMGIVHEIKSTMSSLPV
ncbi:PLP-dependent aminotransferase family protein [Fusibacter sp. JL216-2]|uniref:aminotransferase-like domain-containing protein n=1 Tax=Fusibacter sp. JL216-2 TaxID=3071453 RepID=UPI003D33A5AD